MEELKDDYREDASFMQYVVDTLLLPLRIATSPALLRTYLRTILLFITSTILFGLAVVAYSSFYYSYIPVRGISVPVYLQFDHGKAISSSTTSGTGTFGGLGQDLAKSSKWPYGIANVPDLISRQKYDVVVEMSMPRSKRNLDAGNWMVGLDLRGSSVSAVDSVKNMLGWDEEDDGGQDTYKRLFGAPGPTPSMAGTIKSAEGLVGRNLPVLARSRRPAILTYRSYIIEHAYRLLRLPLYLVGWHTESEHLEISMMESVEFDKGQRNVPSNVKLELRSKYPLEIYTVSVRFSAKLEGLRWIMYRYWLSSAIAGIGLFWSVEMVVLLVTWGLFTLLFSSGTRQQEEEKKFGKRIKSESYGQSTTRIKREDGEASTAPSTPMSNTSRTFPTLPSQAPLHYTSPKEEPREPTLHDIPARGDDAEADDEEDDFVLEEPVPLRTEKEGVFTDSGLGTGIESGREAGGGRGGVSRRRSGRLKDEDREEGGSMDGIDR